MPVGFPGVGFLGHRLFTFQGKKMGNVERAVLAKHWRKVIEAPSNQEALRRAHTYGFDVSEDPLACTIYGPFGQDFHCRQSSVGIPA
jgi:hypothetical protein